MKKFKKLFIIILCIAIVGMISIRLTSNYFETLINLSEDEKKEDFTYLYNQIKNEYPFLMEAKKRGYDIDDLYAKYIIEVESSKTDVEYLNCIDAFITEFNGLGHLAAFDGQMYQYYSNSLEIYASYEGDSALEQNYSLTHIYNTLNNPKAVRLYSTLDSSRDGYRNKKGQKKKYSQDEEDSVEETISPNIYTELNEIGNIAYLKIDSFELENISNDENVLNEFFSTISASEFLLIDITDNPGGSDHYWKELLVKKLAKSPLESTRYYLSRSQNKEVKYYIEQCSQENLEHIANLPIFNMIDKDLRESFSSYYSKTEEIQSSDNYDFDGDIYIITSPTVYSASDNFVSFSNNSNFATSIGKNTSGDGGIDPYIYLLPNSGLIIRFSTVHGINNDGSNSVILGTVPDVLIPGDNYLEEVIKYLTE